MIKKTLFRLDTPYREQFRIEAFEFGPADAAESVGVVGSLRGNEVQQTYIAASLVKRLRQLEDAGLLTGKARILVVPAANSFSMNIASRFWPMDSTDINRMFPGYDQGETTQRIAAGLFEAIKDCTYGLQLASFYLPGEFEPHVRATDTGAIDLERSWELAKSFGFPYAVLKDPAPFDTTTLNYNWQVWGSYAFSLYSASTERISEQAADFALGCIMRFLVAVGAVKGDWESVWREGETVGSDCGIPGRRNAPFGVSAGSSPVAGLSEGASPSNALHGPCETRFLRESSLVDVRTSRAGFFQRVSYIGDKVREGDVLARILSTDDCSVRELLTSPCDGTVFFRHGPELVNADTIAFKIAPK